MFGWIGTTFVLICLTAIEILVARHIIKHHIGR